MDRDLALRAGQSVTYSSVIGVAPRARCGAISLPTLNVSALILTGHFCITTVVRPGILHALHRIRRVDRINAFGRELTEKRGVKLDSFLFDDGWDKHDSLWKFNKGFPDGFTPLKEAAQKYNAEPGVWMSPWGGYSKPKQERMRLERALDTRSSMEVTRSRGRNTTGAFEMCVWR